MESAKPVSKRLSSNGTTENIAGPSISPLVTDEITATDVPQQQQTGGCDVTDDAASATAAAAVVAASNRMRSIPVTIHHHHNPRTPPGTDAHMKAQMAVWSPSDNTPNSRLMRNTHGNLRKALGKSLAHNLVAHKNNKTAGIVVSGDGVFEEEEACNGIVPRPRFDECYDDEQKDDDDVKQQQPTNGKQADHAVELGEVNNNIANIPKS